MNEFNNLEILECTLKIYKESLGRWKTSFKIQPTLEKAKRIVSLENKIKDVKKQIRSLKKNDSKK